MSEQKTTPKEETKSAPKKDSKYLAAILVRGLVGINTDVKDTLRMLNLQKKFSCAILPNNPVNQGMLKKAKNFITYGEIDEETLKLLEQKRTKKNNHYSLHPPRGGFERKGTKKDFHEKGALGPRGEKINDLIKRMI